MAPKFVTNYKYFVKTPSSDNECETSNEHKMSGDCLVCYTDRSAQSNVSDSGISICKLSAYLSPSCLIKKNVLFRDNI